MDENWKDYDWNDNSWDWNDDGHEDATNYIGGVSGSHLTSKVTTLQAPTKITTRKESVTHRIME